MQIIISEYKNIFIIFPFSRKRKYNNINILLNTNGKIRLALWKNFDIFKNDIIVDYGSANNVNSYIVSKIEGYY